MYERTVSIYTFSKTYAMTGLRLGYLATPDATLRERASRKSFYTCSNVTSIVQFGESERSKGRRTVAEFREELRVRRNLFYDGIRGQAAGVLSGQPPQGAFYAFLRINPEWQRDAAAASLSWSLAEHLIKRDGSDASPVLISGRKARVISASVRAQP